MMDEKMFVEMHECLLFVIDLKLEQSSQCFEC